MKVKLSNFKILESFDALVANRESFGCVDFGAFRQKFLKFSFVPEASENYHYSADPGLIELVLVYITSLWDFIFIVKIFHIKNLVMNRIFLIFVYCPAMTTRPAGQVSLPPQWLIFLASG